MKQKTFWARLHNRKKAHLWRQVKTGMPLWWPDLESACGLLMSSGDVIGKTSDKCRNCLRAIKD